MYARPFRRTNFEKPFEVERVSFLLVVVILENFRLSEALLLPLEGLQVDELQRDERDAENEQSRHEFRHSSVAEHHTRDAKTAARRRPRYFTTKCCSSFSIQLEVSLELSSSCQF